MINVIITTFRRPAMLRTALRSIAKQTRLDLVSRVVVSENGGDRGSDAVCREFPGLPIDYIFRDPQVTGLEHAQIVARDCIAHDFTIFLHDDDWWMPRFIEDASRGFSKHPEAIAYCSAHLNLADECAMPLSVSNPLLWFGAGFPEMDEFWLLNPLEVTLATLLHTPISFSASLVRSSVLREVTDVVFHLSNPYDVDRMLGARLAHFGSVIAHPLPDVFRRMHSAQDSSRYTAEDEKRHMTSSTKWILQQSQVNPADLLAAFNDRLVSCPDHAVARLREYLHSPWCVPYLQTALGEIELAPRWRMPARSIAKRALQTLADCLLRRA